MRAILISVAVISVIVFAVAQSPMAYVNGQQIKMSSSIPPSNAKLVKDDSGRAIYVWTVSLPRGGAEQVYTTAK